MVDHSCAVTGTVAHVNIIELQRLADNGPHPAGPGVVRGDLIFPVFSAVPLRVFAWAFVF